MSAPESLLHEWRADDKYAVRSRQPSAYNPLYHYKLPQAEERQYAQQFADMYFLRLQRLRIHIESLAQAEWADFELAGEKAQKQLRVLDKITRVMGIDNYEDWYKISSTKFNKFAGSN